VTESIKSSKLFLVSAFEPTIVDGLRPMRFMGISKAAVKMGYQLEIFTSTFRHGIKKSRYPSNHSINLTEENTQIHFEYAIPYASNVGILRFVSHTIWGISVFAKLIKRERPELIISALPTLTVNFLLGLYSRIYGIKLNIDIIDPWPHCFVTWTDSKIFKGFIWTITIPMKILTKYIIKYTTTCTAISKEYVDWAAEIDKSVKASVFYPAIDFQFVQLNKVERNDLNNKFKLVYAGSFADTYDIPCIIASAEKLKDYDDIEFHFAGKGKNENLVLEAIQSGLNIKYHGVLNSKELIQLLWQCDIGLIQHKVGASQTVTYKFFDYLSANCAIINSLQSEMKDAIDKNKLGINHNPSDSSALKDAILVLYNNREELESIKLRAGKYTELYGDMDITYRNLINFCK